MRDIDVARQSDKANDPPPELLWLNQPDVYIDESDDVVGEHLRVVVSQAPRTALSLESTTRA
jgi:hypothetical protein